MPGEPVRRRGQRSRAGHERRVRPHHQRARLPAGRGASGGAGRRREAGLRGRGGSPGGSAPDGARCGGAGAGLAGRRGLPRLHLRDHGQTQRHDGDALKRGVQLRGLPGLDADRGRRLRLRGRAGVPLVLFHRFEPGEALRLIDQWRPTMTIASITAFIAMMNAPGSEEVDLSSLTKCYSGGAPVSPSIVDRFEEKFGVYIHTAYGLTESNSPTHFVPLGERAPVDEGSGALSIGVPVPNCEARLVTVEDPSEEVPVGESGEFAAKGPMIFKGYWNKPEETEEAFHDGYFLTGDVAIMDEDGWFYIVDRKKDMINVSGYKVWPREVEDVLYTHEQVKEAAAIGVPDEYRGETVKAFVALKEEGAASEEELIAHCKEQMADYKYPRQIEFMQELPKTATGKFLRRELRDEARAGA